MAIQLEQYITRRKKMKDKIAKINFLGNEKSEFVTCNAPTTMEC